MDINTIIVNDKLSTMCLSSSVKVVFNSTPPRGQDMFNKELVKSKWEWKYFLRFYYLLYGASLSSVIVLIHLSLVPLRHYAYNVLWSGVTSQTPSGSKSKTGLNSEFFFWTACKYNVKNPSLVYYLFQAGRRIAGFIPFPREFMIWEMQTALSCVWT